MQFHKQLYRHDPEKGIYGDCYATAIACMIGVRPDQVPHKHEPISGEEQIEMIRNYLHPLGWHSAIIPFANDTVEEALTTCERWSDGLYYLLTGTSRSGCSHVVIGHGNKIIHDPSPVDAGIIGPCDDGYYRFELIVKGK